MAWCSALCLLACGSDGAHTPPPVAAVDTTAPDDTVDALSPETSPPTPSAPSVEAITSAWIMDRVEHLASDELGGRDNGTPGAEAARAYLIAELSAAGLLPAGVDGWFQPFDEGINVAGQLPGSDPTLGGEWVLLTAHYDHLGTSSDPGSVCSEAGSDTICNGATDNAAGCATVLAVARALAAHPVRPRRSILVVLFDAEEDGLLGSEYFASEHPLVDPASIAMVLNADAVGATIVPGFHDTFALAMEYTTGLRKRLLAVNEALGFKTWPVSAFFDGSIDGSRSDHYSFRQEGIPSIFLSSGAPPEYHTPFDEPGIVDVAKLESTARHTLLLAWDLATSDDRPAFVADPKPHIGDAEALVVIGDIAMADPEALGVDPSLIGLVEPWLERLRGYVATPPTTPAEWAEYDEFVRMVVGAVMALLGA